MQEVCILCTVIDVCVTKLPVAVDVDQWMKSADISASRENLLDVGLYTVPSNCLLALW